MANVIRDQQRSLIRLESVVTDLSGGFISQVASYNMDNRFLADVQNMELIQGMWQQRKGYALTGSFTGIGDTKHNCKGVHVFNSQGNLHIIGIYGNTLYDTYAVTNHSTGKNVAQSVPDTDRVRFADFRHNVFIATGADTLNYYDGNILRKVASPVGSLLVYYDDRLLMSGIKGDDLTVYFSASGDATKWSALDYFTLNGGSNEQITALVSVQGKLFIFTNQSIYSLVGTMDNFSVTKEVDGIGAISQEAIAVYGNIIYFISNEGRIYAFNGGDFPVEISMPINAYIQSTFSYNALRYAALTSHRNAVWFTLDNSVVPNQRITLLYYPMYQAWSKFVGIPAAAYFKLNNNLFFTGVHNEGSIYQYGTAYNDEGAFIDAFIKTVKWDFGALENIKRFKELYIRGAIQGGSNDGFDMDVYVDDSKVATVHVSAETATPDQYWGGNNQWGTMYWGYASQTAGTKWGQASWNNFAWNGAGVKRYPKWGDAYWNQFKWGDKIEGTLPEDVGLLYRKLYLSQYNIISGKTLQLVFRNRVPNSGFRIESLTLEYIQKGVR